MLYFYHPFVLFRYATIAHAITANEWHLLPPVMMALVMEIQRIIKESLQNSNLLSMFFTSKNVSRFKGISLLFTKNKGTGDLRCPLVLKASIRLLVLSDKTNTGPTCHVGLATS
ncbi:MULTISPECIES: hypothetical protein [Alkalimonas]|uniref:Secreted protein n=1 Tax=Alkalimonas mucilaginosa TaxID=3057676 RepID=A0ABU7JBZ3_9GAMM|nr:hypothetical protein [Alkalimonas sp. MEB004]MEE2023000.1 hypothetical protein [Alkalimonas sp. MEB004]